MDEANNAQKQDGADIRAVIRQVLREHSESEREQEAPAYKAELMEERRRREQLERRVNELVEDSRRHRALAEETDRHAAIRTELQRHGVAKLDLAFKALRDEVKRTEDGRLIVGRQDGEVNLRDYVSQFVSENPEFLPARMTGGSGAGVVQRIPPSPPAAAADLDKIRPGMDREELERIRQEVVRVALQSLSGR